MRTRFFADLNPAYPSKGQRRYAIFRVDAGGLTRLERPTYTSRKVAERRACQLQVRASLTELGILVQVKESNNG